MKLTSTLHSLIRSADGEVFLGEYGQKQLQFILSGQFDDFTGLLSLDGPDRPRTTRDRRPVDSGGEARIGM